MRKVLLLITGLLCFTVVSAQGFGYDEKVELNQGLYKVKSGNLYGIVNSLGNVVLSIEYQDLLYKNGKALLVKDDVLIGRVDMDGDVTEFSEKYRPHPTYKYIYDGFIPVSDTKKEKKFGFITENGVPFRLKEKMKGTSSQNRHSPTLFDVITPFSEDCATVFTTKGGWRHIDKNGFQRFILDDEQAVFRSSVYHGECIMVTSNGIKLYQEDESDHAVVKKHLSTSAHFIGTNASRREVRFSEGTIVLDSLMRVEKFYTQSDSIIFIQKPRPKIIKKIIVPVDTLSMEEDLAIELQSKVIRAGGDGLATARFEIMNKANQPLINVTIILECKGVEREWNGSLDINSKMNLTYKMPARFSQSAIKRTITATILYKDEKVEKTFDVIVKRYSPVRSR